MLPFLVDRQKPVTTTLLGMKKINNHIRGDPIRSTTTTATKATTTTVASRHLLLLVACLLVAELSSSVQAADCAAFQLFPSRNNNSNSNSSPQQQQHQQQQQLLSPPLAYLAQPPLTPPPRSFFHVPVASQPPPIMRAWTCHGRNQRDLVDRLQQAGIVKSGPVKAVMGRTDRQFYIPSRATELTGGRGGITPDPYQDAPQGIGLEQTISAPHMHAHALEEILPYLQRRPLDAELRLLDVGCGSGYLTACLGRWVQPLTGPEGRVTTLLQGRTGHVYGMDIHAHLVELARRNMMSGSDSDLLESGTVQLRHGNGWLGWPEAAPFDAIHVGAAAAVLPTHLAAQLRVGGVLIVPIGASGSTQKLYRIERIQDCLHHHTIHDPAIDPAATSTMMTTRMTTTQPDHHPDSSLASTTRTENTDWAFDPQDYRVTELLGVRYVPLIQGPSTTTTATTGGHR